MYKCVISNACIACLHAVDVSAMYILHGRSRMAAVSDLARQSKLGWQATDLPTNQNAYIQDNQKLDQIMAVSKLDLSNCQKAE